MKYKASVFIPLAAAILLAQTALAGTINVDFSFTGPGGISGSGEWTATTTADPTIDDITDITGSFTDTGDGVSGPISGLVASSYSNVCPGAANFSAANFSYDNLYYPSGSPAICIGATPPYPFDGGALDIFGVLFNVDDSGTTYTVNLWSNGDIPGPGLTYGVNVANGSTVINDGTDSEGVTLTSFTAVETPEPGALFLTGVGLLGLIAWRFRKTSSSPVA